MDFIKNIIMSQKNNWIYFFAAISGFSLLLFPEYAVHISFVFWISIMSYCFSNIEERILLMFFSFTIFVFCMTQIVIPEYYTNDYIQYSQRVTNSFSHNTYNFIAISCFLSMVSSLIGFNSVKKSIYGNYLLNIDIDSYKVKRIRKLAKWLHLSSSLLVVYSIYSRFSYVAANGYMDSFANYNNNLPEILNKFASTNKLCLYLYLASLPSKKEAKPILLVFLLISVFSLLTGSRTGFIMSLITILVYLTLRNRIDPNNPWLTRKSKIVVVLLLPFIAAFMFLVMLIRGDSSTDDIGFFDMVVNSIYQQGSIIDVLGTAYENAENIPYRFWSFGRIIDSYGNNFIFQLLGIGQEFKSNTAEIALNGHSLGSYLTYTYQTERFLLGGGMGSSFIAESWLDFGYIGVVGFSFIYGIILSKFFIWARKNIWICALAFYMVNAIIYAPRAGASDFISDILSPTYLLLLACVYLYAKPAKKCR